MATMQIFETMRAGEDPLKMFLSPDGDYLAIIFAHGRVFEIFSRSAAELKWSAVAVARREDDDHGRVISIVWHPFLPRQLLLVYPTAVRAISFTDENEVNTHHLWSLVVILRNPATHACLNESATELSLFVEHSILTLQSPFSSIFNGGRYFNAIPERLHRDTGHESLGLWYLENDIVMGVYPLGFFAFLTALPHEVLWQIDISPGRMISSVCVSPDKNLSVAITKDNQADIYNIRDQHFLRTFSDNYGPLKSISMAAFSDTRSIILARQDDSVLIIVPNLNNYQWSSVRVTRLGYNDQPSQAPLVLYEAGLVSGEGRVFLFKGGGSPVCIINVNELSGIEHGEFEINTSQNRLSSPPDIPLTDLNAPVPVAVAVAGHDHASRRHPVQVARRLINGVTWKDVAVGIFLACLVGIFSSPNAPVAVAVAGHDFRRHPVQVARRLIAGVTWKNVAAGGVLACLVGILLEYPRYNGRR